MSRLWAFFRNLFFFLAGVAAGVTAIITSIYIFILQEQAKDRRRGYSGYFARRGTPRAEQGDQGQEPQT